MSKNENTNLNITLKNEEASQEVIVTFSGIFHKLKKYFMLWFMIAVVIGILVLVIGIINKNSPRTPVATLVSFTYDGVEKGKAPDGSKFDYNTLKSPLIIQAALDELSYDSELVENIRAGIAIEGRIPADAIDRITTYKNVYETAASVSAAQAMLDTTWYPTQYTVKLDYSALKISRAEAATILNTMMDCYRDWFFERYGFNEALGEAVATLDYTNYDYAEAVDMFDDTLSSLASYISGLSASDSSRFRSTETGYTFADLKKGISSIRELDLDILSSFISVNNVTKDKDRLLAYYEYRIENLSREQVIYEEELATIAESIAQYEKDQIIVFSDGTQGMNSQFTEASEQYDKMISQKISVQSTLSSTKQRINYYKDRILALKTKHVGATDKVERVEADLAKLSERINEMIDVVNRTADDYYENVSLANSYSILVPATASVAASSFSAVRSIIIPAFVLECLLVVLYVCVALFEAVVEQYNKNRRKAAAAEAADAVDAEIVSCADEDDDADEDEKSAKSRKKDK